jgi:hypothetical protein
MTRHWLVMESPEKGIGHRSSPGGDLDAVIAELREIRGVLEQIRQALKGRSD